MADSFIKRINEGDAGQLLGLAANFSGTLQGAAAFISLFMGSDTDKILNAIDQLRQDLDRDFRALGDLIMQQTQLVVDTVNRDTMALALSRSDIAASRIQDFLANNNDAALETAKAESIGGVRFFTNLGLRSADLPFFLPGLVKAGTIRILVAAAEPPSLREPRSVISDDVHLMIASVASMIASIKSTVDAAHTITQHDHLTLCPGGVLPLAALGPPPVAAGLSNQFVFVLDGFSHDEDSVRLEFFDAQQDNPRCQQPSGHEAEAESAAVRARGQGVADELASLGIPNFEQTLQAWRNLVAA